MSQWTDSARMELERYFTRIRPSIAAGGAVWAWIYERTGSLYGPWLSHLVVDAGIFIIGYDIAATLLRASG